VWEVGLRRLEGLLFKYILDDFRSGGGMRMDGGSVWSRRIELGLLYTYTLWIEENIGRKTPSTLYGG